MGYSCNDEWNQEPDIANSTTVITNIFVYLDTMWSYYGVVDYVNYVLQRLNINPYASSITLLTASDGTVIVNTTNYLADVYENWNVTTHSWYNTGFSLPTILHSVRDYAEKVMSTDRRTSSMGGQSLIALLIPSPIAYVAESDWRYTKRFLDYLNRTIPDLHFIYYAGGAVVRFSEFVTNPKEDLWPLSLDQWVREIAEPVVRRLRRVPRRLVNPRCGSDWYSATSGSNQITQYARLGSINFYRMVPHYFFPWTSMQYLKIQALSAVSFTVCTSRSIALPFRNGSSHPSGQECGQITSNSYSYDLTDACQDYYTIEECPPLYISVQAQDFADATQVACEEAACQTPDQAQYIVFVNNLDCNSGGGMKKSVLGSLTIIALVYLLVSLFLE